MKDSLTKACIGAGLRPDMTHEEAKAIIEAVQAGRFDYYDILSMVETVRDYGVQTWRDDIKYDAERTT